MGAVSDGKDRSSILRMVDFQFAIQDVIEKYLDLPVGVLIGALQSKACELSAVACLPDREDVAQGAAPMTSPSLIARLEEAAEGSRELDAEAALALGWTQKIVSGIGLNGRTPGRLMWFPPYPNNGYGTQKARPPRFSGPRQRNRTIAILKTTTNRTDEGAENG